MISQNSKNHIKCLYRSKTLGSYTLNIHKYILAISYIFFNLLNKNFCFVNAKPDYYRNLPAIQEENESVSNSETITYYETKIDSKEIEVHDNFGELCTFEDAFYNEESSKTLEEFLQFKKKIKEEKQEENCYIENVDFLKHSFKDARNKFDNDIVITYKNIEEEELIDGLEDFKMLEKLCEQSLSINEIIELFEIEKKLKAEKKVHESIQNTILPNPENEKKLKFKSKIPVLKNRKQYIKKN